MTIPTLSTVAPDPARLRPTASLHLRSGQLVGDHRRGSARHRWRLRCDHHQDDSACQTCATGQRRRGDDAAGVLLSGGRLRFCYGSNLLLVGRLKKAAASGDNLVRGHRKRYQREHDPGRASDFQSFVQSAGGHVQDPIPFALGASLACISHEAQHNKRMIRIKRICGSLRMITHHYTRSSPSRCTRRRGARRGYPKFVASKVSHLFGSPV